MPATAHTYAIPYLTQQHVGVGENNAGSTRTVTGMVSEVFFDTSKTYNLAFRYDPMGNRIAKIEKPKNWVDEEEWKGLNFICTSHMEDTEMGAASLLGAQLLIGHYTIRSNVHNHPEPDYVPYPSGFWEDPDEGPRGTWGDVGFATQEKEYYIISIPDRKINIEFQIYMPQTESYINYDENSKSDDY